MLLARLSDFIMAVWCTLALVMLAVVLLMMRYGYSYIRALMSGVRISPLMILAMWLRRVKPDIIINALITARCGGIRLSPTQLEAHSLAGGNVLAVVKALVIAKGGGVDLSFDMACAIDLCGRDVLTATQSAAVPFEILLPHGDGRTHLRAAAGDSVLLRFKAHAVVRVALDRVVGGKPAETLIRRLEEALCASIAHVPEHVTALNHPAAAAEHILTHDLDADTQFKIEAVSIDEIAKV